MGRGRRSPSSEGFSFPSPRFPLYKLMRIAPVLGGSPVGLEGHVEDDPAGTDVCHERGDALPGLLRGGFGDFKQQFVMHLEQQSIKMNNQKGNDKTVLVNISLLIGNLIVINTQSDDTAEIIEHKIRMAIEKIAKSISFK